MFFISHYVQIKLFVLVYVFIFFAILYIPLRSDKTFAPLFSFLPLRFLYIPLRSDKTQSQKRLSWSWRNHYIPLRSDKIGRYYGVDNRHLIDLIPHYLPIKRRSVSNEKTYTR